MTDKDLDGWIALKIMGWRRATNHWVKGNKLQYAFDSWHPTESISDAFQVVEKMRTTHFKWFEMAHRPNGFTCNFSGDPRHTVFTETAPLAICLAAKKAIEGVE